MKYFKDIWLYARYYWRYIINLYRIYALKDELVTVFGGKHIPKEHIFYRQAYALGQQLALKDFTVLTGGGEGIMQAAICGAYDINKKALGILVDGIDRNQDIPCKAPMILAHNLATRKQFLISYSQAIIVFPGGIGTIDELTEVMNAIKLKKMEHIPIILFGKDFWKPFVDFMHTLVEQKFILKEVLEYIKISDDVSWIVDTVDSFITQQNQR